MGLDVVLRHALAEDVHDAEDELGGGMALLGGRAKPLRCRGKVLRHAYALTVHDTKF